MNGVPREILLDGDGSKLNFADGAFDLVCEFAVLHHVKRPDVMVREMLRVARRAVFISDCNNFGQGSPFSRTVKQLLRAMRLWPVANWLKSGRKGYYISEGDGLFYSYSVFDAYPILREQCDLIHIVNTSAGGPGIYRSCGHAALLAIKR